MADDPLIAEALAVLTSKTCPFADLSSELLASILPSMPLREFSTGEHLMRQGDPGDGLLVILSGTAEAFVRHATSSRTKVGRFGPGDVVGEISPLTGEARTADVVSRTPVRALELSVADFHKAAEANPEVRMLLTNVVADRLGKAAYDGLGGKDIHGYHIVRCAGRGGMGVVYEATRLSNGETVALKMLNHRLLYQLGAVQRFRREADALAALRHGSIARLYECFAAYGTHFLAMEFCEGSTLREILAKNGALNEGMVRPIIGQLAGALHDVHRRGLVHRDIKPSNIMVSRNGTVKLLDFGLVVTEPTWPDGDESNASTQSQSGVFRGTPRYMAPEQFTHAPVDHRADLYSLACVAYEALAGRPVVEASDLFGIAREKLQFVLPPPHEIGWGITDEMHAFLARGLEHRPEKRTVDLEQLAPWASPVELGSSRRTVSTRTLLTWAALAAAAAAFSWAVLR